MRPEPRDDGIVMSFLREVQRGLSPLCLGPEVRLGGPQHFEHLEASVLRGEVGRREPTVAPVVGIRSRR